MYVGECSTCNGTGGCPTPKNMKMKPPTQKIKFTPEQLKFIKAVIEKNMYTCCTFASQAELLRDWVMRDLRK